MSTHTATVKKEGQDTCLVELGGIFDQTIEIEPLIADQTFSKLVIDFDQIKRMNSSGVRIWLLFIQKHSGKYPIEIRKCQPPIVEQMSLIDGFLDGVTVQSIYLPYLCANCGNEASVLVEAKDFESLKTELPVVDCESCGAPKMDFDYIEDAYFHFLNKNA